MEADLPDPELQADQYASKFLELTRVIPPEIGQNKAVLAAVTARCMEINKSGVRAAITAFKDS